MENSMSQNSVKMQNSFDSYFKEVTLLTESEKGVLQGGFSDMTSIYNNLMSDNCGSYCGNVGDCSNSENAAKCNNSNICNGTENTIICTNFNICGAQE